MLHFLAVRVSYWSDTGISVCSHSDTEHTDVKKNNNNKKKTCQTQSWVDRHILQQQTHNAHSVQPDAPVIYNTALGCANKLSMIFSFDMSDDIACILSPCCVCLKTDGIYETYLLLLCVLPNHHLSNSYLRIDFQLG